MNYLLARLQEPSSSAGIATVVLAISQIVSGDFVTGVPSLIGGLLAFFIPEGSSAPAAK
jgi:hypothetical protein